METRINNYYNYYNYYYFYSFYYLPVSKELTYFLTKKFTS